MRRTVRTFGDLLRQHRLGAGLTQQRLSDRAGISLRALRDIESGRVRCPRPLSARRLTAALPLSDHDREALAALIPEGGADGRRLDIGILGPLVVRRRDARLDLRSSIQRAVLGLLVLHAGEVVATEAIVEFVWQGRPPRTGRSLVHDYVGQLRRLLEPQRRTRASGQVIATACGGYRLDLDVDQHDLGRFDDLVARARAAQAGGHVDAAVEWYDEALCQWRGPVLADAGSRVWHYPSAVAAGRRRLAAALAAADLAIGLGRYQQPASWLSALLPGDPLHEGLCSRMMIALAGCGQQAEALRLYFAIRSRLADELGVEPGPELAAAYLRVLRQQISATNPRHVIQTYH